MLCLAVQPSFLASLITDASPVASAAIDDFYAHHRDELFVLANQIESEGESEESSSESSDSSEDSSSEINAEPSTSETSTEEAQPEEPKAEETHTEEPQAEAQPSEQKVETPAEQPAESEEDKVGIDTAELTNPAGNWLYKRIWWERAQNRYEQIKGVFDQILESRMPFSRRRSEIDRKVLEPLYVNAGMGQSEIVEILGELNQLLEIEQEKHKTLDNRQRALLAKVVEDKKILEQLQKDIQALGKFDDALDEALIKLMEQVNAARNYEKQAWNAYKEIGKELNDKRARELYYSMDTHFKNITNVADYVQGIFKQHFDKVDKSIQEYTLHIKDVLQSLREKGFDLKESIKQIDAQIQQEEAKKAEAAQETEPVEEGGIMHALGSWWHAITNSVYSGYQYLMSFIPGMSSSESHEAEETEHANSPEDQQ